MIYTVLKYKENKFIPCYQSTDEKLAVAEYRRLKKEGFNVIIDYQDEKK